MYLLQIHGVRNIHVTTEEKEAAGARAGGYIVGVVLTVCNLGLLQYSFLVLDDVRWRQSWLHCGGCSHGVRCGVVQVLLSGY